MVRNCTTHFLKTTLNLFLEMIVFTEFLKNKSGILPWTPMPLFQAEQVSSKMENSQNKFSLKTRIDNEIIAQKNQKRNIFWENKLIFGNGYSKFIQNFGRSSIFSEIFSKILNSYQKFCRRPIFWTWNFYRSSIFWT